MIKALAVKELREIAWIAALALLINLAMVSNLIGLRLFTWAPFLPERKEDVPFVDSAFTSFFSLVVIVAAIALGFRQSAWETGKGTYLFLLHRPVRRDTVFFAKLATGFILIQVCAAIPILLYGWWAAVPGHHPSPFEWSMTADAWKYWLVLPLLYLGAFLSGLRPGRWLGTRLLPLLACGVMVLFLSFLSEFGWFRALWLLVALAAYGLLVMAICYVARQRDYS